MPLRFYFIPIVMGLSGIFSFFGCKGRSVNIEHIDYAPFKIERKNSYGSRYDINTASKRDDSRSSYKVFFDGQLIKLPEVNENNRIWKVFVLDDAPMPTLLVANKGIYLVESKNNSFNVKTLARPVSDFARLQFIGDSETKASEFFEIYHSDDTENNINLSGGRYLLINKSSVLEVNSLELYPFSINYQNTNGHSIYNFISLSQDEKKIVFMGQKYDGVDHYSLLEVDFRSDVVNIVPFDRNETRLHEPYEENAEWFDIYFTWEEDEESRNKLVKKKLDPLPPWEGHFTKKGGNYSLSPVKRAMLEIFIVFLKEHQYLSTGEIIPELPGDTDRFEINKDDCRIGLSYLESISTVYLSAHFTEDKIEQAQKIINDFGIAFNTELKKRKHQDLFTAY